MNKTSAKENEIITGGLFTEHGIERTMEYMHINRDQAARCVENAWKHGKTIGELNHSRQRQYLAARDYRFEAGPSEFRVYKGHLFIFTPDQGMLVTMYPTPESFDRKQLYAGKERVRKAKRYSRMVPLTPDYYDYEDFTMIKGAC